MAADTPMVQPVPDATFTNTQLDGSVTPPKERKKLEDSFSSFFSEIDAKAAPEPAPEAEDHELPDVRPDEPEAKSPSAPSAPEPDSRPDEPAGKTPEPSSATSAPATAVDLETLEAHPNASPETKSQFAQLKEITKGLKETTNAYKNTLQPVLRELGFELGDKPEDISKTLAEVGAQIKNWKNSAISPEIQNELETLREISRGVGILQDKEFTKEYWDPIQSLYHEIIPEMAQYFDASEEQVKKDFIDPLLKDFKPNQLKPQWWESQVALMTKAPEPTKWKITSKIADLLKLQDRHDKATSDLSTNKESYDKWMATNTERYQRDYQALVSDEVSKALASDKKDLAVWLPKKTDGITDPVQLEEISKHNAAFSQLERKFGDVIKGFSTGPRAAARYGLDYLFMQETIPQLKKSVEEKDAALKTITEERDKLKIEVSKRRKLGDSPLQPSAGTGAKPTPEKASLPKDARKSLSSAFDDWKTD